MADNPVKGLTPDEQKAHAERIIEPDLRFSQHVPNPRAILTGGQPGSGKSYIVAHAGIQFEDSGGVIVIDPDAIRPTLPYMKARIDAGQLDIPNEANVDAGTIAYQMVQIAKREHRNVIVDGTLQNTGRAMDLAAELRSADYRVEFHGMAVSPDLSHARTYSRREDQIANSPTGFGRGVSDEFHDQAVKGYVVTVDTFQKRSAVNSLTLYAADGAILAETEFVGGVWRPAVSMKEELDQAHTQPTPATLAKTEETWTVASAAMRARAAPADEQAKVDGFQAAATARLAGVPAAPSPAERAAQFDAACAAEGKAIVERATRIEQQLGERRQELRKQAAAGDGARPSAPRWKPGAAKAAAAWAGKQDEIARRIATTTARIERVSPFTQPPMPGYPSAVDAMAVRKVARREPQMTKEAVAYRESERQRQAQLFTEARSQQQSAAKRLSR